MVTKNRGQKKESYKGCCLWEDIKRVREILKGAGKDLIKQTKRGKV